MAAIVSTPQVAAAARTASAAGPISPIQSATV